MQLVKHLVDEDNEKKIYLSIYLIRDYSCKQSWTY